jgi:hypothetical protein
VGGIIFVSIDQRSLPSQWRADGVDIVLGGCAIVRYRRKYQAFPASGSFE